jgi:hypothetical protein
VTGWPAGEGLRAELVPAIGLTDSLTGTVGEDATVFVALARLTAEPEPLPLEELVSVRADDAGALEVRWSDGGVTRVRLTESGVDVTA